MCEVSYTTDQLEEWDTIVSQIKLKELLKTNLLVLSLEVRKLNQLT